MQTYAFGLGNIELFSALNEPFNAKISVTALNPGEGDDLQVKLASNDDFDKVGIERLFLLTQLTFRVVSNNNKTYIIVKSKEPIKEPFLDFLITVTTGKGRLLHEYTVLLDPPKQIFQQSRAPSVKPAVRAVNDSATYQQNEQTIISTPYVAPTKSTPAPLAQTAYQPRIKDQGNFDGSQYGPTGQDDTLWTVAKAMQTDNSVTVQQVAMAIFAKNPHAFINNDINILKMNATLKKPELATIQQLSPAEASARFYGKKPVQGDLAEPNLELLTPTDEDEVINNTEEDATQSNSDKIDDLSNQLDLAVETIETQKQESDDYRYRMDTMLEQLDTMNQLMALKDAELARLQAALAEQNKNAEVAVEPQPVVEPPMDAVDTVEQDNTVVVTNVEQNPVAEDDYMAMAKSYLDQAIVFVKLYQLWFMVAVVVFLILIFALSRRSDDKDKNDDEEEQEAGKGDNEQQQEDTIATVEVTAGEVKVVPDNNTVAVEEVAEEDAIDDLDFSNEADTIADEVDTTAADDDEFSFDDDFDLDGDVELNNESIDFEAKNSDDEKVDLEQAESLSLDDNLSFDTAEELAVEDTSLNDDLSFDMPTKEQPATTSDDILGFADDTDSDLDVVETEQEIEQLLSADSNDIDEAINLADTSQDAITDLDVTVGDSAKEQLTEAPALDSFDLDDMELDLDEQDGVDVKLELASAYIEMDDIDSAKSILDEVFNEGREAQKLRAQAILDAL